MDSLELYHPSREFTITLPDLPSQLSKQELSGLWLHGMLMFCGMKITNYDTYFTCFELKKNEDSSVHYWEENEGPRNYLRTTQVSMLRPEKSWELYAIGGSNKLSTSVRIYDLASQSGRENTEAFLEGDLYAHIHSILTILCMSLVSTISINTSFMKTVLVLGRKRIMK